MPLAREWTDPRSREHWEIYAVPKMPEMRTGQPGPPTDEVPWLMWFAAAGARYAVDVDADLATHIDQLTDQTLQNLLDESTHA